MRTAVVVALLALLFASCSSTPQTRVDSVTAVIREESLLPQFEKRLKRLGATIVEQPGMARHIAYILIDSQLGGAATAHLRLEYSFNEKLEVRCEDQSIVTAIQ